MLTRILKHRAVAIAIALSAQCGAPFAQQVLVPELAPGYGATSFGMDMVGSGGELFVGAPTGQGFVEVYRRVDGLWSSVQRLVPVGAQGLGRHIAVEGEWLAASSQTPGCVPGSCAYSIDMYRRVDGAWVFAQRVDAPSVSGMSLSRVDLASESLIVTVDRYTIVGRTEVRVFTYRLLNGTWGAAQELVPPYVSAKFGWAFAADGDTLVTSDPFTTSVGAGGAVSTFKWIDGAWAHRSVTTGANAHPYLTGMALALCGDRLFVGSSGPWSNPPQPNDTDWISVYRPDVSGNGWVQEGNNLMPLSGLRFGFWPGLACSGSTVAALVGGSNASVNVYAVSPQGFSAVRATTDPRAEQPKVAVVGGDVAISNPYGPGPEAYWEGKVSVFLNAVDPVFLGRFE